MKLWLNIILILQLFLVVTHLRDIADIPQFDKAYGGMRKAHSQLKYFYSGRWHNPTLTFVSKHFFI